MHIAFRVDSSTIIGYGHVMRCLTLAHALSHEFKTAQKNNIDEELLISLICRDHQGHINQLVLDNQFNLLTLPSIKQKINAKNTDSWLGTTFEQDSLQCITHLESLPAISLLIVDHYAIDHHWHTLMKPYYQELLVIDDLANRTHACDYLLDQTFNRDKKDYHALVPEHCQLLLGQAYMLLRSEFSLLKAQAKRRRNIRIDEYNNRINRVERSTEILITMGGTDPDNLSQLALGAIDERIKSSLEIYDNTANMANNITTNIVISSQSIHLPALTLFCEKRSWATLIIDSKDMANLMLSADIAIGACGGTAWERCCLGLPCLTTVNAKNQQLIADNLSAADGIINLGWHQNITSESINTALTLLLNTPLNYPPSHQRGSLASDLSSNVNVYEKMVNACFNIVDGKGADSVARIISKHIIHSPSEIKLDLATEEDCELIYRWQSNKDIRRYFINTNVPTWQEHVTWYSSCLLDPNRRLYLLHDNQGNSVGLLRLDQLKRIEISTNTYEISIIIASEYQGKGVAVKALQNLKRLRKEAIYMAKIHDENIPSQKSFIKAGFHRVSPSTYQLNIINFQHNTIKKIKT